MSLKNMNIVFTDHKLLNGSIYKTLIDNIL